MTAIGGVGSRPATLSRVDDVSAQKVQRTREVVPFTAGDGVPLNLVHYQGTKKPTKGPVLLVHGAGVRAEIFDPPHQRSLVDHLIAEGYDVWSVNWRASIDLPKREWTLDQAALYDHPAAVQKVLKETGAKSLKAVVHCQGANSFLMAAAAGHLPQVDNIVASAIGLHPVVPEGSRMKLKFVRPVADVFLDYLNPDWGNRRPLHPVKRALDVFVRKTHDGCDNAVCKHANFTYGTGENALWRHEQLSPQTHEWLKGEFKNVPMSFFKQMSESVEAGEMRSHLNGLPATYTTKAPRTDARIALMTGRENQVFLPDSIEKTHAWLRQKRGAQSRDSLKIFDGYSHLDIFFGKNAAKEVFPVISRELAARGR